MVRCDECKKPSIFFEKYGNINLCKICYIKLNGLFEKHKFEKSEDIEQYKSTTLNNAHKHNFSQTVITAINEYCNTLTKKTKKCDCCNNKVIHLKLIGKAIVCMDCFEKINITAWKRTEYNDNNEVEINRQKVLKIANKNCFPSIIIKEINNHFDTKIQPGLIYKIDGLCQKLKIFETYCELITSERFDADTISKSYAKALNNSQTKNNLLANIEPISFIRSVLKRGIIKTGISVASTKAIDVVKNKISPTKCQFKVVKGKYKINYVEYDTVDYQIAGENEIGFIRFTNNKHANNPTNDVLFFFRNDNKKFDKAYNYICDCIYISKKNQIIEQGASLQTQSVQPTTVNSVADEILKFKNLLDQGIITQEEFDKKKKELLKL